jgi:hypothetical protein
MVSTEVSSLAAHNTWEPYSVMAVDVPDIVAKFMESHEDIDAVREIRSL